MFETNSSFLDDERFKNDSNQYGGFSFLRGVRFLLRLGLVGLTHLFLSFWVYLGIVMTLEVFNGPRFDFLRNWFS